MVINQLISSVVYPGKDIEILENEWEQLLNVSTRPSIYSSYNYIQLSLKHFSDQEIHVFFIIIRDKKANELLAVFPMSIETRDCFKKEVKVLQHAITTHNSDVDKPYPIIHKMFEKECWLEFKKCISAQPIYWDWLEYDELIPESILFEKISSVFSMPKYFTRQLVGPTSPIVDLRVTPKEFVEQHRNMRRKRKTVLNKFGENYRYKIYNKASDMDYCLKQYINVELGSWKANVGVSEPDGTLFYKELLPLLAEQNAVYIGILYDGKTPVSAEISYCYSNVVYFALGCYRDNYAELSPGSVSTSLFIEYFLDKDVSSGDFLAGFADYMNPLANKIEQTKNTVVYRINRMFIYFVYKTIVNKFIKLILGRK